MAKKEIDINKDDFEKYVAVNTKKADLLTIFNVDEDEMDEWCWKTYHMNFKDVYAIMIAQMLAEYKATMKFLAESGNATAMATMNKILLEMSDTSEMNITISGYVPKEDEQ